MSLLHLWLKTYAVLSHLKSSSINSLTMGESEESLEVHVFLAGFRTNKSLQRMRHAFVVSEMKARFLKKVCLILELF
jgi:hypothetical protein